VLRSLSPDRNLPRTGDTLKTVETHRSHINRKLGVHSPAELIRLAALKGLLVGQQGAREASVPAA